MLLLVGGNGLVMWAEKTIPSALIGQPFDDTKYRRELRRVTTLDIPEPAFAAR